MAGQSQCGFQENVGSLLLNRSGKNWAVGLGAFGDFGRALPNLASAARHDEAKRRREPSEAGQGPETPKAAATREMIFITTSQKKARLKVMPIRTVRYLRMACFSFLRSHERAFMCLLVRKGRSALTGLVHLLLAVRQAPSPVRCTAARRLSGLMGYPLHT